jgi:sorting nexin-25
MLKESLWPGGQLRSGDGCPQTDQQKAAKKQEALRLLKNFLPDVLRWAAGSRVYDDVMEELLEMVQDPWINRHLIYTLLDLIIESVIEHSANEDLSPEIL